MHVTAHLRGLSCGKQPVGWQVLFTVLFWLSVIYKFFNYPHN